MVADGESMLIAEQRRLRAVRITDGELLPVPGADSFLVEEAAGSEDAIGPINVAPLPDGEIAFTVFPGPVERTRDPRPVWRTVNGDVEAVDGFILDEEVGVFRSLVGLVSDADGTLYLVNQGPGTVTAVTAAGEVCTVAQDLQAPRGLAIGPDGTLYVSEIGAHRVVAIAPGGGEPEAVAGRGRSGFTGDGGPATAAALDTPEGLATDGELLWIADSGNERVRVVRLP
jgi:DNA-binding beta-propeller fold protein YncE